VSRDPDSVGYKRPPKDHQFPPGQSGNPKGRPRGRKNFANVVKDALNKPVRVRVGGKVHRMPTAKAILHAVANAAASGDAAAAMALVDIMDMTGRTNEITDEAHNKHGLRLPLSFSMEEHDYLVAEPRERERLWDDFAASQDEAATASHPISSNIQAGDRHLRQDRFDEALAAYQAVLSFCKEELTLDRGNRYAEDGFRRGVARIGLVSDKLLHSCQFKRAVEVADLAIQEGGSEFWVAPRVEAWMMDGTNTVWLRAIRAHACMMLGQTEIARNFYFSFKTTKNFIATSWETSILRDFVRLRKEGIYSPLMDEIERALADEGWNLTGLNSKIKPTGMKAEDALHVQMHPDDLKSGDLLREDRKPHEAMEVYLANLKKWAKNVALHPERQDWQEHVAEATDRIILTAGILFKHARFPTALEYADKAVAIAPHLLTFQVFRACALMFIGNRDDEARTLFLKFRGGQIADNSWDDAVLERIADLREAGCKHVLMGEIERLFREIPPPESLTVEATHEPSVPNAKAVADRLLVDADDIPSGDRLFASGRFEDALLVYTRRLKHCTEMIAAGRVNTQILEDNGVLPRKFSEVAFAFILRGEPAEALATTVQWPLTGQSELHPVLAVRQAHALAFLGRDEEAQNIYRRCRGQLVERGLTVEQLIATDCARLEAAGQELPPAIRDQL
jgi:tetratricopeptide (TPR) repeat protein